MFQNGAQMCVTYQCEFIVSEKRNGPVNLAASINTPHINLSMSTVICCQWFSWKFLHLELISFSFLSGYTYVEWFTQSA